MIVVGIETTCDETSVGIFEFSKLELDFPEFRELSLCVLSQDFHSIYGGVVPELASRSHLENINHVFEKALSDAGISPEDIDLVAVASEPGLPGSLIVGVNFAKGIAHALGKKIIAVNHVEAHIISPLIENSIPLPFYSLVVSGGHTSCYLVEDIGKYKLVIRTQDDAVGEAFDKIAKFFRLGYPGGPIIDELSQGVEPLFSFPEVESENFSFSGIKTFSVRTPERWLGGFPLPEFLASFQKKVIDEVLFKTLNAIEKRTEKKKTGYEDKKKNAVEKIHIAVSGGVARNTYFRKIAKEIESERNVKFIFPSMRYCIDNGGMIAFLGGLRYIKLKEVSPFSFDIRPTGVLKSKGGIET